MKLYVSLVCAILGFGGLIAAFYREGAVSGCSKVSKQLVDPRLEPTCLRSDGKLVFQVTVPVFGIKQYDAETGAELQ